MPVHLHVFAIAVIVSVFFKFASPIDSKYDGAVAFLTRYLHLENTWVWSLVGGLLGAWIVLTMIPPVRRLVARHPLTVHTYTFIQRPSDTEETSEANSDASSAALEQTERSDDEDESSSNSSALGQDNEDEVSFHRNTPWGK